MHAARTGLARLSFFLVFWLSVSWLSSAQAEAYDSATRAAIAGVLPAKGELINPPEVENYAHYGPGVKGRVVKAPDLPGARALEVKASTRAENLWEVGVVAPILEPVARGETVVAAFWMRCLQAPCPIVSATLQQPVAPYKEIARRSFKPGPKWQLHYLGGVTVSDFAYQGSQFALHIGNAERVLELGPLYVLNLGADAPALELPPN